jgi:hypothetical protein
MDEGLIGNILIGVVIALFLVGNLFLRKRSMEKTDLGKVAILLAEINHNLKIVDAFSYNLRVKKFKTGSWARNKDKIDFVDERIRTTLANAFNMAEEFNQKIAAARKYKSSSYLASVEVDKLRNAMTKSQQELGEWFTENKDSQELLPKRRGLFGR